MKSAFQQSMDPHTQECNSVQPSHIEPQRQWQQGGRTRSNPALGEDNEIGSWLEVWTALLVFLFWCWMNFFVRISPRSNALFCLNATFIAALRFDTDSSASDLIELINFFLEFNPNVPPQIVDYMTNRPLRYDATLPFWSILAPQNVCSTLNYIDNFPSTLTRLLGQTNCIKSETHIQHKQPAKHTGALSATTNHF